MPKFIACLLIIAASLSSAFAETRVTTQTLEQIAIYPAVDIPASVVSMNDSKLSAEVSAVVKKIPVLVGDTVKRGDVLIELDNRDYKLQLLRAEVGLNGIKSRLKLANYQFDQAKTLFRQKAITDELLQQREAEVSTLNAEFESQKVAVSIAKRNLEKCLVSAPFNAIVTERLAQVGELAGVGTPLVRIIDASRIEVSAKIQPQDIASLSKKNQFSFISQKQRYSIAMRKLTPAVDLIQRNQEARFTFTDKHALPGASGTLSWKQLSPHVPANLILRRDDKFGIFIQRDNSAEFFVLDDGGKGKPGMVNLPMSTAIIIDGRFGLQHGDAITVDQ